MWMVLYNVVFAFSSLVMVNGCVASAFLELFFLTNVDLWGVFYACVARIMQCISFLITCLFTAGIFYCIMLTRPDIKLLEVFLYLCGLVSIGIIFILTDSFIIMFVMFESLLATALALLKLTSKSERIGEAISEMFM
jgi:formate hydrogenlyase subunit 3/multisubunit Na+/H+ antiporter MnhD subunit